MLPDIRLKRAAARATRALTESLESRVLFAEVAGTLLVDVNATGLANGSSANDIPNAGTLGGVFESTEGGTTIPVIGRPSDAATSGTVGIRLDGNDFLRLLQSAGGPALTAPAAITGADSVSIEVWVWNPGLAGEETMVSWGKRGGPDGSNMSFNYGNDGTWGAVGHWGAPDMGWGATNPVARQWHHLAYTYDGTVERLYVDGAMVNSETQPLFVYPDTSINIGSQTEADGVTATAGLRGTMTIGKLRIHDGVLTDAQVLSNYNSEKAGFIEPVIPNPPPPLVKLVDVDPTGLQDGALADNLPNAGTVGGVFHATQGGDTVPVIDQPLTDPATTGTVGIRMDGNDFLQQVVSAQDTTLMPAPASLTGVDPKSSIEVWAWNPGLADEETILSWGHRGGPDGANMSFNYGANAAWGAMGHWGSPDLGWGATNPVARQWHHLVYTFDGNTQRVYVDGAQTNSEVLGEGALNIFANPPITLGAQMADDSNVEPALRGTLTLGRVRIYSGILTPQNVADDYNNEKASYVEPAVPPPPLVKLVDVDATIMPAGTANDIPNNGTLGGLFEATGGGATIPVIGQPLTQSTTGTKGIRLDGNDYLQLISQAGVPSSIITTPNSITGPDPKQSLEAWVYNPGIATEETIAQWGRRGGNPDGTNTSFNYGSSGGWGAMGRWGAGDIGWGQTVPAAQQWHHVVYTYDGATSRVYVDGALANTEVLGEGVINVFQATAINIGTQLEPDASTPTPLLRGSLTIGKLRIYSGILTDAQISTTYNAEKAAFVNPDSAPPVALTAGPTHRYTFSNTAGNAITGTVVPDTIGSANATVLGDGATFNGQRLALPGGSSATQAYIDLPNGILSNNGVAKGGTGQVTLEGWVRQTGNQSWSRIYDFGSTNIGEINGPGSTTNGVDFTMLTAQTGGDPVHRFETNNAGDPGSRWDEVTHPFDNQDLHFVFTWNEATNIAKYYENGKEVGSLPSGVLISDIDDVNNWLGRSQFSGDGNFQGEFDEFRVYNRVLSAGEVQADFQSGADVLTNTPPTITSIAVNPGSAQRSQVKQLTVTFDRPVTLAPGAGTLQLLNTGGSGLNDNSPPTDASAALVQIPPPVGGKTWTYTIAAGTPFSQTSGANATGSLVDGIYTLTIDPTKVSAFGIPAVTGGSLTFHRLFGDINGSKNVNAADYNAFRQAFGKPTNDPAFNPAFDFDNNNNINASDYNQFRTRFGKSFTYT